MEQLYLRIDIKDERFVSAYLNYVRKTVDDVCRKYDSGYSVEMYDDAVIEVCVVFPEKIGREKFSEILLSRLRTKNISQY